MSGTRSSRRRPTSGYPLLVKAAFGGGGRGMRVVASPDELAEAVDSAQREAASAFGDGTVFLERFVERPRHVEVQVFGDHHGSVVHLFERECSIQRRHQKIDRGGALRRASTTTQRAELCDAAVAAAKAIGYVDAGTVEFVLDGDGRFWFLEVNTRLQVEHPVTELVTGLDLVALQLAVAQGEPLPAGGARGRDVRSRDRGAPLRRGRRPRAICPVSGTLHRFRIPEHDGVRVDAGYADGSVVSAFYDALLAKVDRVGTHARGGRATARPRRSPRRELHGPLTNRDLLVRVLEDPEFLAGHIDTGFLDRLAPAVDETARTRTPSSGTPLAAALAARSRRRRRVPAAAGHPGRLAQRRPRPAARSVRGRRRRSPSTSNSASANQAMAGLVTPVRGGRRRSWRHVVAARADAESWTSRRDDGRRRYSVQRVGDTVYVDSSLGASALRSSTASRVARGGRRGRVAARPAARDAWCGSRWSPGQRSRPGDVLVVLEAMKMEHTMRAPYDGASPSCACEPGSRSRPAMSRSTRPWSPAGAGRTTGGAAVR